MRSRPLLVSLLCIALVSLNLGAPQVASARGAGFFSWSLGAKAARRRQQARQIKKNARVGRIRDGWATFKAHLRHPFCSIQKERYLLNSKGRWAKDRNNQGRRFDIAVISPFGRLLTLIEVTGRKTDKRLQDKKTRQILGRYRKLFIEDQRDGSLVPLRRGWLWPTKITKDRI